MSPQEALRSPVALFYLGLTLGTLIVAGLVVVPEGRRPALWAGVAAITVQCAVAIAAVAGPTALERRPRPALTAYCQARCSRSGT